MNRDKLLDNISTDFAYFMPAWRKHMMKDEVSPEWVERGMGMQHVHVLAVLGHHGAMPISHVGMLFSISKSDMTRITDKLQELELIERQPSTSDRRVIDIILTEKGREFMEEARRARLETFKEVLEETKEEELVALRNFMERFLEKMRQGNHCLKKLHE